MKIELRCNGYQIIREPTELVEISARFVLMASPKKVEEIAEALKRIELYLGGAINLVKSDGSNRCFYCGTKQADEVQNCTQCGAPL